MVWNQHQHSVATFSDLLTAEQALLELRQAGFQHAWLSPDDSAAEADSQLDDERFNTYLEDDDEADSQPCGALVGSLLGAAGGCVAGLGLVLAPGITIPLALGTWGATLLSTIAGAGLGAVSCGLVEAISCHLSPEDCPCKYRLMIDGSYDEVIRAASCLKHSH
jgi:hypothetical protein